MINNSQIQNVILSAIDEVNQELSKEHQIDRSMDTILFGKSGKLDSLGLVSLIVTIEQRIEEEFEIIITLADDRAMSQKNSPFRDIGRLTEYICMRLKENSNG